MKRLKRNFGGKWTVCFFSLLTIVLLTFGQYFIACVLLNNDNGFQISAAISASVATTGVLLTAFSYYKYKEEQKVKITSLYNKEYRTNVDIQEVLEYLMKRECNGVRDADEEVKKRNKRELFFRFFEEIQYLIDKDLIDEKEAYDLFGYYANEANGLKDFLPDKKEENWKTLGRFIEGYKEQLGKQE